MNEILAFSILGSTVAFWGSLLILIIVCFISEKIENGFWAFGCFVLFSVAMTVRADLFKPVFAWFHWQWLAIYLGAGFGHAVWRFYHEGRKFGAKLELQRPDWATNHKMGDREFTALEEKSFRESVRESSRMQNPKASAFRWWFNWPVSLTYYIFSELIGNIWSHIWDNLKKFFTSIYEAGIKSGSKSVAKK